MADRLLKPNQEAIAVAFGTRLTWSLQHAGLSVGQAAKKLREPRGLVERWAAGEIFPNELHHLVDVANVCGFDPRWLATGEFSDSTADQMERVKQAFVGKKSITTADRDQVLTLIQRLPVPDRGPGECRYCGCTDIDCTRCIERTGYRCCWVDEDVGGTICSACLEPSA